MSAPCTSLPARCRAAASSSVEAVSVDMSSSCWRTASLPMSLAGLSSAPLSSSSIASASAAEKAGLTAASTTSRYCCSERPRDLTIALIFSSCEPVNLPPDASIAAPTTRRSSSTFIVPAVASASPSCLPTAARSRSLTAAGSLATVPRRSRKKGAAMRSTRRVQSLSSSPNFLQMRSRSYRKPSSDGSSESSRSARKTSLSSLSFASCSSSAWK
mmetsp:Transcript_21030/g.65356  ORF Transcript_21030/g.65356 Transcript_21030/m.65356 type:complete len:215 (+) Transcript_21030:2091-2735(+)